MFSQRALFHSYCRIVICRNAGMTLTNANMWPMQIKTSSKITAKQVMQSMGKVFFTRPRQRENRIAMNV